MKAEVALVQEFPVEGVLRIRINTYREPGEPGYEEHHVQVPSRDLTQEEMDNPALAALVPKVWQNNPCLNQFIKVKVGTTPEQLQEIMREHIKRVKKAPIDLVTSLPDVKAEHIQRGLQKHLQFLGVDRTGHRPRSIRGLEAVRENHPFLTLEVRG
jgi:hypothetical protein